MLAKIAVVKKRSGYLFFLLPSTFRSRQIYYHYRDHMRSTHECTSNEMESTILVQ